MIRFQSYICDALQLFDDIVKAKRIKSRGALSKARPVIVKRYEWLESNQLVLRSAYTIKHTKARKKTLKEAYSKATAPLKAVKAAIRKAQPTQLVDLCPYCCINKGPQFDHVLPQAFFPEYSVHPMNLVPCCSNCNDKKGERWRDCILFLTDPINYDLQYFRATVAVLNRQPVVNFELIPDATDELVRRQLQTHCGKLDLFTQWEQVAANELGTICNQLYRMRVRFALNPADLCAHLGESITDLVRMLGPNHWKVVAYRGLLDLGPRITNFVEEIQTCV